MALIPGREEGEVEGEGRGRKRCVKEGGREGKGDDHF